MVVQGYLLYILVQLKEHTMLVMTNRISNKFNSITAHLELYETCLPERFCENNEQLKEVINLIKDLHHKSLRGL